MHKKILFILAVSLAGFTVLSCGGSSKSESSGVEFIINNGAEPKSIDPAHISGVPENRIWMALFEGLVSNDPKTALPVPGVAKSWDISKDGTVITFHLRKDAVWSDGTPITAQTFIDSWLRTLDPKTASEYAYLPAEVIKGAKEYNTGKGKAEDVGIKALDPYTFQVTLVGPIPYAISMMAHYSFSPVPMHVIKKYGDDWIKPEHFVSNGPFVLSTWKPQEKLVVTKNSHYWDAKNIFLSKIIFYPIDDNNTAYQKFVSGEIDWDTSVPIGRLEEISKLPTFHVAPQSGVYYYEFNVQKAPTNNVYLRKALAAAINRKELVERVTRAGQIPATSFVPPMPGYTPVSGESFNPEKAKELIAKAGYPNGKGLPKLTIIYNTSDGHKLIAEYIQNSWKKILGVDVELKNYEWKTFLDMRQQHDFQIARAGWVSDYIDPSTFLDMFISNSGENDPGFSNKTYDELLKKSKITSGKEREKIFQDAEKIIMDDQIVIPLYFYVSENLINTNVWKGWYAENPLDVHPYKGIKKVN